MSLSSIKSDGLLEGLITDASNMASIAREILEATFGNKEGDVAPYYQRYLFTNEQVDMLMFAVFSVAKMTGDVRAEFMRGAMDRCRDGDEAKDA
jgi:hypothetical protein